MLTLLEQAKLINDPLVKGVVETFPRESAVLEKLPFWNANALAFTYNREASLPGIGFRGINETFDESTGVINPVTENLKVLGGLVKVDEVLTKGNNAGQVRAVHTDMKAKAAALAFTKYFFKGDTDTNPRQFDGLEKRLVGGQVLDMGSTSGGDTLTLAKLDELIDAVVGGPDTLFMNKTVRRKVNALMRAAGQAQETVSDSFGRQIPSYAGIPIGIVENDETDAAILDFNEAAPGGGNSVCTSIYGVRFGTLKYVSGLQMEPMEVKDLGLSDDGTFLQTRIQWICSGCAIFHPRAAARLRGIKNA